MSSGVEKKGMSPPNPEEETLLKYRNVENFEDILQMIGPNSWRNILVFIATSFAGFITPLVFFTYGFLGATPDHWCSIPELQYTNWTVEEIKTIGIPMEEKDGEMRFSRCEMYDRNYEELSKMFFKDALAVADTNASILECSRRAFENIPESVVTKWDLVCDRRAIYATTQSAVHCGSLVGCLLGGYFMGKYGRILVYRVSGVLHIVAGFLISVSPSITAFICLRVISATTIWLCYMASFVIAVEFTTCSQRSLVATYYVIPWAFGMMLASLVGYLVRTWYLLQVTLTFPTLILLFSMYYLPESSRWLVTKGKFKQAYKILNYFAQANGKDFPYTRELEEAMKLIQESSANDTIHRDKSILRKFLDFFKDNTVLLRIPQLRMKTFILFFCYMSVAMIYYSISLGSSALKTSNHLFIFLGGIVELISYLCLWPAAALLGRRCSLVLTFWICTVTLICVMVLIILVAKSEMAILKLALFLIGKFAVTANFHLLWVYTAELYPTTYRSLALAQNSTLASIGSIASPYLSDILGEVTSWAPSAVFGALSLVAGLTGLALPETNKKALRDGLEKNTKRNIEES